jgi:hypothetical protein
VSLFDTTDEWAIVEALVQAYRQFGPNIGLEIRDTAFEVQVCAMLPVLLEGDELRDRQGYPLHTISFNERTFTRATPYLAASGIRFVSAG